MTQGAERFVEWLRDAPPNRMYYFMLDGKPYRGSYNRKFVGKQVQYYTGVSPTRYSKLLEHIPKGFEVSDEPVVNPMDRWLYNKPLTIPRQRHEELIMEQPLYGGIVGHNGISNEAVRRPEVGFKIVKQNPFTGKQNELETTVTKRLGDLQTKQAMERKRQLKAQSKFSNPMEQPPRERNRVKKMNNDAEMDTFMNELDIYDATPVPAVPKEYQKGSRATPRSGIAATSYLDFNKEYVKNYIDTLTDRSMNSIIQKVGEHFNVNQTRVVQYLALNPSAINKNKK
jgi:hypothetical protein